ncbi:MAG: hypothetical protein IJS61_09235 [Firmicutes bacterium]|nr:hypothetical protein [Bacillota bacterium]
MANNSGTGRANRGKQLAEERNRRLEEALRSYSPDQTREAVGRLLEEYIDESGKNYFSPDTKNPTLYFGEDDYIKEVDTHKPQAENEEKKPGIMDWLFNREKHTSKDEEEEEDYEEEEDINGSEKGFEMPAPEELEGKSDKVYPQNAPKHHIYERDEQVEELPEAEEETQDTENIREQEEYKEEKASPKTEEKEASKAPEVKDVPDFVRKAELIRQGKRETEPQFYSAKTDNNDKMDEPTIISNGPILTKEIIEKNEADTDSQAHGEEESYTADDGQSEGNIQEAEEKDTAEPIQEEETSQPEGENTKEDEKVDRYKDDDMNRNGRGYGYSGFGNDLEEDDLDALDETNEEDEDDAPSRRRKKSDKKLPFSFNFGRGDDDDDEDDEDVDDEEDEDDDDEEYGGGLPPQKLIVIIGGIVIACLIVVLLAMYSSAENRLKIAKQQLAEYAQSGANGDNTEIESLKSEISSLKAENEKLKNTASAQVAANNGATQSVTAAAEPQSQATTADVSANSGSDENTNDNENNANGAPSVSSYTVEAGDTGYKICNKVYGRYSDELWEKVMAANGMRVGDVYIPGQVLNMPE